MPNRFRRNRASELRRLVDYLENKADGCELSYLEVEEMTGCVMDNTGKNYLRSAVNLLDREYRSIAGWGIVLADSNTAVDALHRKVTSITQAVKRSEVTHRRVCDQFYAELGPEDQRRVGLIGGVLAQMRVCERQLAQGTDNLSDGRPVLPSAM